MLGRKGRYIDPRSNQFPDDTLLGFDWLIGVDHQELIRTDRCDEGVAGAEMRRIGGRCEIAQGRRAHAGIDAADPERKVDLVLREVEICDPVERGMVRIRETCRRSTADRRWGQADRSGLQRATALGAVLRNRK